VQYGSGFAVSTGLIGAALFFTLTYAPTTCFDGVQNGSERGVDCGGECVRICAADALPPQVVWAESFEIAPSQYNATAYVENVNDVASVERLTYTFELLDGDRVVATRRGETVLPPDSVYPLFEGRINTNGETVTNTRLTIDPVEVWQPATAGREQFAVRDIRLTGADARPRLDAEVENQSFSAATDVEVVVTLFNDAGQPLTSSETYIAEIAGRSRVPVVFTWPNSIAKTVRTCSIPSDVVLAIDLSGSMNNDSANPPQPLTDATAAAARFVERLGELDQVAVVTFATEALLRTPLTTDRVGVARSISDLAIDPAEERGFTNTGAALETVAAELESPRRNFDARRAAIILTDGLPTGQADEAELVAAATAVADQIDAAGALVYAIGLGENVDRDFVRALASRESQAYFAPSGGELDRIYTEITGALCETGTARIDVIAKTKANFTPLR
jgi:Mg-chelatase subunit ChlD